MFKTKFIISISVFVTFLLITSVIKNKTRITEKKNFKFKKRYLSKRKKCKWSGTRFLLLDFSKRIGKKIELDRI